MLDVEYFAPSSLAEATSYLAAKDDTVVIAGGTDVVVAMEYKDLSFSQLLDLKSLEKDLSYIKVDTDGTIRIGSLSTADVISRNPQVKALQPHLAAAADVLGCWQVRVLATIGGNICNAAPSAEFVPSLMVSSAKVVLEGKDSRREVAIEDFMLGPGKTDLRRDEILTEFVIPPMPINSFAYYGARRWRRSMDLAIANLAALVTLDEDKAVKNTRICLGAVGPTAFLATETMDLLLGKILTEDLIEEAAASAGREARPITDIRGTIEYRRDMIALLMKRALQAVVKQDQEEVNA